MINGVFQACYTNKTNYLGDRVTTGWESVAVSENIPKKIQNKCKDIHINAANEKAIRCDESGKWPSLYEIDSDDAFIYITKIVYGVDDVVNARVNMFAHTYILPWEDCISNPNNFLTITEANFKSSETEALEEQFEFIRREPYKLKDVLSELGMDIEAFRTLIKCVYVKLWTKKGKTIDGPLYIEYDGTEEQQRKLLFSIYSALPYHLRKKISTATDDIEDVYKKAIVFTTNASEKAKYIIPKTMENNVITAQEERDIENDGFVSYVLSRCFELPIEEFYGLLERVAQELKGSENCEDEWYGIAYQTMMTYKYKELNQETVEKYLSKVLTVVQKYGYACTSSMMQYINTILYQVVKTGIQLTNVQKDIFSQIEHHNDNEEMRKHLELYKANEMLLLPLNEAAKELTTLDEETFKAYKHMLLNSDAGIDVLTTYYEQYCIKENCSWEELKRVYDEIGEWKELEACKGKVIDAAKTLYAKKLQQGNRKNAYLEFVKFIQSVLDENDLINQIIEARELYWKTMTFEDISIDDQEFYSQIPLIDFPEYNFYKDFLRVENSIGWQKTIQRIYKFFGKYRDVIEKRKQEQALDKLVEYFSDKCITGDEYMIPGIYISSVLEHKRSIASYLELLGFLEETSHIREGECARFVELYEAFVECIKLENENKYLTDKLNKQMLEYLKNNDNKIYPIPIDAWLIIGKNQYRNMFEILEHEQIQIVKDNKNDSILNSEILKKGSTIKAAESYIEQKNEMGKIVKFWLHKIMKESKKNNKSSQKIKKRFIKHKEKEKDEKREERKQSDE